MNENMTIAEVMKEKEKLEYAVQGCLPHGVINNFSSITGVAVKRITFEFIDVTCRGDGNNRKSIPGMISIDYNTDPIKDDKIILALLAY